MATNRQLRRSMHPERCKKHFTCPHCHSTTYITKAGRWYKHRMPSEAGYNHPQLMGPICPFSAADAAERAKGSGEPLTMREACRPAPEEEAETLRNFFARFPHLQKTDAHQEREKALRQLDGLRRAGAMPSDTNPVLNKVEELSCEIYSAEMRRLGQHDPSDGI